MVRRLLVVCNALDDRTRLERGITTDSPAASRKVFMMCRTLRLAGIRATVLSLGRGRQDGSRRRFVARVRRVGGVPVIYGAFWHCAMLSQLLSLLAPALALWRTRRLAGEKTALFYNCMPAYVPGLVLARLLGLRTVLDLEDGAVPTTALTSTGRVLQWTRRLFDRFCTGGALLACRALEEATTLRPTACYYGTVEPCADEARWPSVGLRVLIGGTVAPETGADLLIDAIAMLRLRRPDWAQGLDIHVTGSGSSIAALRELAAETGWPAVTVHGRTTDAGYREIVEASHVGLALKPRSGPLARTTFPSKVIELAGAGLLLLTTDISDVRVIFGSTALYLEDETAAGLVDRLRWISEHREEAQAMAARAARNVHERFAPDVVARSLSTFLFGHAR
jgi:glycosyltransferase involved in cell wall biosynthesis